MATGQDYLSALLSYNVQPLSAQNGIIAPPDPGMGQNTTAGDPVTALVALRQSLQGGAPTLNLQRQAPAVPQPNPYNPYAGAAMPTMPQIGGAPADMGILGTAGFADPGLYQPPALAPLSSQLGDPYAKLRLGRAN